VRREPRSSSRIALIFATVAYALRSYLISAVGREFGPEARKEIATRVILAATSISKLLETKI